ncbi:hypothetical protein [uncultured Paracoccus sp.]|uniref:hypothetical protein n=1 Tax=uncultured Paracoccus sp. TaxID=189685 RepID=UPI0025E3CCB8|nr:hypothetical protein [uncultured Paracoccus sp.]
MTVQVQSPSLINDDVDDSTESLLAALERSTAQRKEQAEKEAAAAKQEKARREADRAAEHAAWLQWTALRDAREQAETAEALAAANLTAAASAMEITMAKIRAGVDHSVADQTAHYLALYGVKAVQAADNLRQSVFLAQDGGRVGMHYDPEARKAEARRDAEQLTAALFALFHHWRIGHGVLLALRETLLPK